VSAATEHHVRAMLRDGLGKGGRQRASIDALAGDPGSSADSQPLQHSVPRADHQPHDMCRLLVRRARSMPGGFRRAAGVRDCRSVLLAWNYVLGRRMWLGVETWRVHGYPEVFELDQDEIRDRYSG